MGEATHSSTSVHVALPYAPSSFHSSSSRFTYQPHHPLLPHSLSTAHPPLQPHFQPQPQPFRAHALYHDGAMTTSSSTSSSSFHASYLTSHPQSQLHTQSHDAPQHNGGHGRVIASAFLPFSTQSSASASSSSSSAFYHAHAHPPHPSSSSSHSSQSSSPALHGQAGAASSNSHLAALYKTELCKSWLSSGSCKYGVKCKFAHGAQELVHVQRHKKCTAALTHAQRAEERYPPPTATSAAHPSAVVSCGVRRRYKTERCRNFSLDGRCRYGERCKFIHDGEQIEQPHAVHTPQHSLYPASPSTFFHHTAPVAHHPAYAAQQYQQLTPQSIGREGSPSSFSLSSPRLRAASSAASPALSALSINAAVFELHRSRSSSVSSSPPSQLQHAESAAPSWLGASAFAAGADDSALYADGDERFYNHSSSALRIPVHSPRATSAAQDPRPRVASSTSHPPGGAALARSPPLSTHGPPPGWSDASAISSAFGSLRLSSSSSSLTKKAAEREQKRVEEEGRWQQQQQQQHQHGQQQQTASRDEVDGSDPAYYHLQDGILNGMADDSERSSPPPVLSDDTLPRFTALHQLTASRTAGNAYASSAAAVADQHASARYRSHSVDQQRPSSASSGASSRVGSTHSSPHPPFDGYGSDEAYPVAREERADPRFVAPPGLHRTVLSRLPTEPLPAASASSAAGVFSSRTIHPVSDIPSSSSTSRFTAAPAKAVSPSTTSSATLSPQQSTRSPAPFQLSGLSALASGWERSASFSSVSGGGGGAESATSTTRASSYAAGSSPLLLGNSPFSSSPFSPTTGQSAPPPHLLLPRSAHHTQHPGSPALSAASSASSSPYIQHFPIRRHHRGSEDLSREDKEIEESPTDDRSRFSAGVGSWAVGQQQPGAGLAVRVSSSSSAGSSATGSPVSTSPFLGGQGGLHIIDDHPQAQAQASAAVPPIVSPSSRRPPPVHTPSSSSASSPASASSAASKARVEGSWRTRPAVQQ